MLTSLVLFKGSFASCLDPKSGWTYVPAVGIGVAGLCLHLWNRAVAAETRALAAETSARRERIKARILVVASDMRTAKALREMRGAALARVNEVQGQAILQAVKSLEPIKRQAAARVKAATRTAAAEIAKERARATDAERKMLAVQQAAQRILPFISQARLEFSSNGRIWIAIGGYSIQMDQEMLRSLVSLGYVLPQTRNPAPCLRIKDSSI